MCGSHGRDSQDPSCHACWFPHAPSSRNGCLPRAGSLLTTAVTPSFQKRKLRLKDIGSRPHSDYLWIQTQVGPIPKPSPSPQHHIVPTPADLVKLCLKTPRPKKVQPLEGCHQPENPGYSSSAPSEQRDADTEEGRRGRGAARPRVSWLQPERPNKQANALKQKTFQVHHHQEKTSQSKKLLLIFNAISSLPRLR